MTSIRKQSLKKQVLVRDFGLCRCCGFKGDEVHHITPLVYGGGDNVENMILLCSYCHRDAPNTKQEFYEYMTKGGSKTERILGMIVNELEINGLEFHKYFPIFRQVIKWVKDVDRTNSIETYSLKDALEVNDVDFKEEERIHKEKKKIKDNIGGLP